MHSEDQEQPVSTEWELALIEPSIFPPDEFPDPVQTCEDLGADGGVA